MVFIAGDRLEWIMKQIPQIVLAVAVTMAGTTLAMAQNGPPTRGYHREKPKFRLRLFMSDRLRQPYYGTPYGYPGYSYDYPGYTYGYTGAPGWR
jgi:hypothetical protein